MKPPKRVLHVIVDLNKGGAETMLYNLCSRDSENIHAVFSIMNGGYYAERLRGKGIEVYTGGVSKKKSLSVLIKAPVLYVRALLKFRPNIIQAWMYHAAFLVSVFGFFKRKDIFWGVHHSSVSRKSNGAATNVIIKVLSFFSKICVAEIFYCANAAKESHEKVGWKPDKSKVIFNGYDVEYFCPLENRSTEARDRAFLSVGMVARFHPLKNHELLFEGVRKFIDAGGENIKCKLYGPGMVKENSDLATLIDKYDLHNHVSLNGPLEDIRNAFLDMDVHILSSVTEAFPNVLAEAMACGVPCITTDVGDASNIVGQYGWVIPSDDSGALSTALFDACKKINIQDEWDTLKAQVRSRIVDQFSVRVMVESYQRAWQKRGEA